jgi:hypothetical protein
VFPAPFGQVQNARVRVISENITIPTHGDARRVSLRGARAALPSGSAQQLPTMQVAGRKVVLCNIEWESMSRRVKDERRGEGLDLAHF